MEKCIKDGRGELPGMPIFLCYSKTHTRRFGERSNKLYPQY